MRLVACMPVRNEGWVLGLSARVALQWCDALVVALHECEDDSDAILDGIDGEIAKIRSTGRIWDEMPQRQAMLLEARRIGATHVAIVDADEVLTGNLLPSIRGLIEALPPSRLLYLPGYNLRHGLEYYHSNGIWGQRWFATAFVDHARLCWNGDQYHHREPCGMSLAPLQAGPQGFGGTMHLWGASERRLKAKHRMYRMLERLRWPNKPAAEIERLYRMAEEGWPERGDTPDKWRYNPVPDDWWEPHADALEHLRLDAVPWQEAWCDSVLAEHGAEKFAGLKI